MYYFTLRVAIVSALFFLTSLNCTLEATGQFRMTTQASVSGSTTDSKAEKEDPIPDNNSTVGVQGGRYGIGIGSAWPAYGISGTLQVSETITAEAVLGFFGDVSNFGGRLWYRFNRNEKYDLYGYGAVGVYTYRGFDPFLLDNRVSETVLGIGAGAGIEAGLPKLFDDEDLPPIFINAELGLAFGSFQYYGGFSSIGLGLGVHYRFGEKK
ncbi:MAG: hypothetical protein KTR29_23755 [Rhodothermaceae bacterium]|nr:hypothetical protein [Rhodothermaceae bacterium]